MKENFAKSDKSVCVITCYKHPNYARGQVIRRLIEISDKFDLISLVNSRKNIFRYPEIVIKLLYLRIKYNPDIYILTFRGYEVLPVVRAITLGKKLIFDEFINPIEWAVYEHKKISENNVLTKITKSLYKMLLISSNKILTDTNIHAKYSSELMGVDIKKYYVLPVSADEDVFKITKYGKHDLSDKFQVLYYGNMLPLHGVDLVLEAAKKLRAEKNIHFLIIGGNKKLKARVSNLNLKNVKYINKVPLSQLPDIIAQSDLCLGGPFGGTTQARMVVTGKTYQFLAMSKPVLVGKIDEDTKFIDKSNSLVIRQGRVDEIYKSILWAYKHQNDLYNIADEGKRLYDREYSNKRLSVKFEQFLKTI